MTLASDIHETLMEIKLSHNKQHTHEKGKKIQQHNLLYLYSYNYNKQIMMIIKKIIITMIKVLTNSNLKMTIPIIAYSY